MAKELAFTLINPYTIGKSRTGNVISRFLSRTGMELVAARMFGPSRELAERYAELTRSFGANSEREREQLAEYILRAYTPEAGSGRRRRVLLLLFEGEDAVSRLYESVGHLRFDGIFSPDRRYAYP